MKVELGFTTSYQYWKESYGQASWQTMSDFNKFVLWDGIETLKDLVNREYADFIKSAEEDEDAGHQNYKITLTCLRIGGQVVLPVEKQEVYLRAEIIEA